MVERRASPPVSPNRQKRIPTSQPVAELSQGYFAYEPCRLASRNSLGGQGRTLGLSTGALAEIPSTGEDARFSNGSYRCSARGCGAERNAVSAASVTTMTLATMTGVACSTTPYTIQQTAAKA